MISSLSLLSIRFFFPDQNTINNVKYRRGTDNKKYGNYIPVIISK